MICDTYITITTNIGIQIYYNINIYNNIKPIILIFFMLIIYERETDKTKAQGERAYTA